MSIRKFQKNYVKFEVLSQKQTCFLGQKVPQKFGKSSEKFGNRVFRTFRNFGNFRNCSIPKFPKITKNDIKLELQKSRKTRSDSKTESKTDSKVWLKVRNAGP